MSKIINSNGGRVNKIIGDGLLSYFPESKLSDCVRVAIKIHQAVAERGMLAVGIGCDFGEVTVGDIGKETRLDYTLVGAPVNFASRMCDSAARGEVMLSDRLVTKLEPQLQAEIQSLLTFAQITVRLKANDPEMTGVKFAV